MSNKKVLSMLLAAAMTASALPSAALAAGEPENVSPAETVEAIPAAEDTVTFTEYNDAANEMYKVVGRNRRDARTDSAVPYQDEQTALAAARDYRKESSDRIKMLTGEDAANQWDMTVVKNLKMGAERGLINEDGTENYFINEDFDTSDWKFGVKMPSSWTSYGEWWKNINPLDEDTGKVQGNVGEVTWVWDYPIYNNVKMPWQGGEQPYNSDDEKTQSYGTLVPGEAPVKYNPIGFYKTTFNTDDMTRNDGDRVLISFQGVESAYYVFVNGQIVGYSEDSYRPHEFDITDYLIEGNNRLDVRVHKFSDSTWLEDQDMIYDGGIFRDVYLISEPAVAVEDYTVETDFVDESYTDADLIIRGLKLRNNTDEEIAAGYDVTVNLYEKDNTSDAVKSMVFTTTQAIPADSTLTFDSASVRVEAPAQWSAEKPNLYLLSVNTEHESAAQLVGFREITFTPHSDDYNSISSYDRIRINGQPLLMKGVNRHDSDPLNGKYVSKEVYETDLKTMKQFNINTIRTAHYANDEYLYYLADTQGFYVMAETNAECHAVAQRDRNTADVYDNKLGEIFKDRTITSYQTLKNHSSIVSWSVGNECGGLSDANQAIYYWMADYFHEHDKTRPVHVEFVHNRERFDMESNMYPTVEYVQSMASTPDASGSNNAKNKPYFLCEYDHAMGNAVGDLDGYWNAIRSGTNMIGGCIWDWVDQSRIVPLERVTSDTDSVKRTDANKNIVPDPYDYYKDGKYLANEDIFGKLREGYFFGYGGDWGDVNYEGRNVAPDGSASGSGTGQFCVNGLVSPDRQPQPELYQVKYEYQSFWMKETPTYEQQQQSGWTTDETLKNQKIVVYNENNFTNLNEYNISWELKENGEVIASGDIADVPSVEPKQAGEVTVPFGAELTELKQGAEYALYIEISEKYDKWAVNAGHEIAHEQFELSDEVLEAVCGKIPAAANAAETGGDGVTVTETDDKFSVSGNDFSFEVSKKTGFLSNYVYKGETLIKQLKPNYTRANHDNDSPQIDNWRYADEEKNITPLPNATRWSDGGDGRKVIDVGVKIKVPYEGDEYAKEFLRYTVDQSGALTYRMYLDTTDMPNQTAGGRYILRLGSEIQTDSSYEDIMWYGNGINTGEDMEYGYNYPVPECYRDRDTFAVKGVYSSTATDMYFPHLKNQETGTVNNVTWAALTSASSDTAILVTADKDRIGLETDPNYTDNSLEVSALHYSTKDLRNGAMHPYEMVSHSGYNMDTESTYFNVDHKSVGIGNKSCGPDTRENARITTGSIFDYAYTIIPAAKSDSASYSALSASWNETAETDVEIPEFSKEIGSVGYTTPDRSLPEKVTVDGAEQSVIWETDISECPVYSDTEIEGTLSDGTAVTGTISVYPDNLYYFVNCGDNDTSVFDAVKAMFPSLKNNVQDQTTVQNGWGMVSTEEDYGNPDGKETDGDKDKTGYYVKAGKTLDYSFTLEPGRYTVTEGTYEFWTNNAARTMKVTVSGSDGTELGTGTMTLDSKNGIDKAEASVSFVLDKADTITVSLSRESGADPVLSWIGIAQALPYAVTAQEGITASLSTAYAGETVTLSGNYAAGSLFVKDESGADVAVTAENDGKYSFVMPKSAVTVTGLINTDTTVYAVPKTVERVRGGSETDNRNYYIKNNCALGMIFDIPGDKTVTAAKLHFVRQNTAPGQKTNVYHQDKFEYANGTGYIAQYNGNTQTGLELSELPSAGEYKLLLAYDESVSESAAGNDYYVIDPVDNSGNASEKQRPSEVAQLPYLELTVKEGGSTPTDTPTDEPSGDEKVWQGYRDGGFTGENPDYSIAWALTNNANDQKGASHTIDTDNNIMTITSSAASGSDVLYGVVAAIKGVQPNTRYTLTFMEKTELTEVKSHGVYVNMITQAINWKTTNIFSTKDVSELSKNNDNMLHKEAVNDEDWHERTITYVTGSGKPDGYDTLEAKFTFILRGSLGTVQIKDLKITGAAEPEPAPTPTPVPAPTKDPDKDYTPEVHTGKAIDRLNTDETFQYHFAGGTDAFMETGKDETTADNGKKYDAYMWVPKTASPDTLRGLVAIKVNLIEVPLAYSKVLREALAEDNVGILFIIDKNDLLPEGYTGEGKNYKNILQGMYTEKDYKGDDLFTADKWKTYDGKDAADIMNDILSGIAEVSGYECVAENTPVITIGHSAASPFGYRSGNWAYDRVIAQIDMKNGMWGDATDSSNADNDAHGFGMVPGIPSLQYAAQYTEHAVGAGRDRSVCDARYHIEHQRAVSENYLVSHIIEWGSGHYDWSNNASEMITEYIKKAIEYRVPDSFKGGNDSYTLNDLTQSGYLMKPFEKDNGSEREAGYYAANGWLSSGMENASAAEADKKSSFWFFDRELAEAMNEFTKYAIPESPGRNDTGVAGKTHTDKEPYMLMKDPSKSVYADTVYDFNSYISPFDKFNGNMSRYGSNRFINYEKMDAPEKGNGDSNPSLGAVNTGDLRGYDTLTVDTYYMSEVPSIETTNGEAYDGTGDAAKVPEGTKAEVVPLIAPYELIDSELVDTDGMTRDGSEIADSVASVTRNTLRFHNNRVYYNTGCQYTNGTGQALDAFAMIYSPEVKENGEVVSIFKSTGTQMNVPYVAENKGTVQTLTLDEIDDVTISGADRNKMIDVSYTSSDEDLQKYTDVFVNYGPARAVRTVDPEDGSYSWQIEILKDQIPEGAEGPIEISVVASNLGKWEKVSGAADEIMFNVTIDTPAEIGGRIEDGTIKSVYAKGIEGEALMYAAQYDAEGVLKRTDIIEFNGSEEKSVDIPVVGENVKLMLWNTDQTPLCNAADIK